MKVGILGAGGVGTTLGRGLAERGHGIIYAVREPDAPRHGPLRESGAQVLSVRAAVEEAEVVILATPWPATEAALAAAGDFAGKPLIDATNPIGPGFALTHGHTDSGAEQVQRWATNAKVVKAFNTTGRENMADPAYPGGPVAMFLCGDDEGACRSAATLCGDLGFDVVPVGGLERARLLEPVALLWITLALKEGHGRGIGFGLLRR